MKSCEIFLLLKIRTMATNFSPCKGSYVLNQFPSNVMFGMNGFHVSASGAIQGHHGPLVCVFNTSILKTMWGKERLLVTSNFSFFPTVFFTHLENFLPFSSNLKLSSANSFTWEESKICYLGKGLISLQRDLLFTGYCWKYCQPKYAKEKRKEGRVFLVLLETSRICSTAVNDGFLKCYNNHFRINCLKGGM